MLSLAFFVELMSACCFAAYFVRQPAGITYSMINSTVKIDCVIAGSASLPLWKINGTIYNIHLHPPVGVSYIPDGLMISPVLLQWNNTSFQCYVFGLTSTIGYLIVQLPAAISSANALTSSSFHFQPDSVSSAPLTSFHTAAAVASPFVSFHSVIESSVFMSFHTGALGEQSHSFECTSFTVILTGSSDVSAHDVMPFSTGTMYLSSAQPFVSESNSYGNETTEGNNHDVRFIYISAVVSSLCTSLVAALAVCIIIIAFTLRRKKRKDKRTDTRFLKQSNPAYGVAINPTILMADLPVDAATSPVMQDTTVQHNPSYGLVTANTAYEEITL